MRAKPLAQDNRRFYRMIIQDLLYIRWQVARKDEERIGIDADRLGDALNHLHRGVGFPAFEA